MPFGLSAVARSVTDNDFVEARSVTEAMPLSGLCAAGLDMCACHRHFIPATPVTEGMVTSDALAADVRQASTCGLAIRCDQLGFNVLFRVMNNAYPAQACPMDTLLFGNQLDGVFFNLGDAATVIMFVPIVEILTVPGIGVGGTDFIEYLAMRFLKFVSASGSHRDGDGCAPPCWS